MLGKIPARMSMLNNFLPCMATLEFSAYIMLSFSLWSKWLKSRSNKTTFNCRFFLNRFFVCFYMYAFVLLFLVNSMPCSGCSALHEVKPNLKKKIVGQYYTVDYNSSLFPGIVTAVNENGNIKVKCLSKAHVPHRSTWKWPGRVDEHDYWARNIKEPTEVPNFENL